jgi:hypothetical protein
VHDCIADFASGGVLTRNDKDINPILVSLEATGAMVDGAFPIGVGRPMRGTYLGVVMKFQGPKATTAFLNLLFSKGH